MVRVEQVLPGSSGFEIGLQAGDQLVSIDGRVIRDLLDYGIYVVKEEMLLTVLREDGEEWEIDIEKERFDDLGLELEHPDPTRCGNNCVFCFVHQLPKGMRRTLYVKDEDFRFSYLYGAYVTLSNIAESDIERIIEQKLSPLYISVHATDEKVRETLLGRSAPPILPILKRLVDAGIELHTQIVICPGLNDDSVLTETISEIHALSSGVLSLALVPVGLTKYRDHLPALRLMTKAEARAVIDQVETLQQDYLREGGYRFVFAADELYLNAEVDLPDAEAYEDYPQIENGVGLVRQFRQEAAEVLTDMVSLQKPMVSMVTGRSAYNDVHAFVQKLSDAAGIPINLYPITNNFFGDTVTVTGLITGSDIVDQIRGKELGSALLIPEVMLKDGEEYFLDDVTLEQLSRELDVPVYMVPATPWGIVDFLEFSGYEKGEDH